MFTDKFLTTGQMAKLLQAELGHGVTYQRIQWLLRDRGIEHVGQAGHIRLYDKRAFSRVRKELRGIDARRVKQQQNHKKVAAMAS